ncbi:MAG: hydroxyethylthiazole kinase [Tatlockia sp.]|nr:hydroxyethylthiazole kinase [Tatlockia sp.]
MELVNELENALISLREVKPLVLCLTNNVTMDFVANSLLALGAAPLMSESVQELEELVSISHAVYINIGTLNQAFSERALSVAQLAQLYSKPLVLDPVGAGASRLRTDSAKLLVPFTTILRCNASEILALANEDNKTNGVEATHLVSQASGTAKKYAQSLQKVVAVSGSVDFITDGCEETNLPFGSPLMPLITGMGCALTGHMAAFATLKVSSYKAAILATAYFGLCGQQSSEKTKEPGSFRQFFIDSLYKPDWKLFKQFEAASQERNS